MNNKREHSDKRPAEQGAEEVIAEPNKIGASTPYDFESKNLTAYGGLLPVATMLEKLGFEQLVEETLTVKRELCLSSSANSPRAIDVLLHQRGMGSRGRGPAPEAPCNGPRFFPSKFLRCSRLISRILSPVAPDRRGGIGYSFM